MTELRPCPFCGGKPREHDDYVECCMTLDMAADEWNDRPIEDELRARIKELEEKITFANPGNWKKGDI